MSSWSLATSVDVPVLGKHHWRIADLNSQLAECYRHMQHTKPILGLLQDAYEINRTCKQRGNDSLDTLNSLLELGQFMRDQSMYSEAALKLKQSVEMAERLYNKSTGDLAEEERKYGQMKSDKITEAADAEQQAKIHKAKQRLKESRVLLIEAYDSYGDYFHQVNKEKQSKEYFEKGTLLYNQAVKNINEGSISGVPVAPAQQTIK
jgi:tetratricopeptide (TPR) repeat protein